MKSGDNFMLGPYHFAYMSEKNGRIKAVMIHKGYPVYSLDAFAIMADPTFRVIKRTARTFNKELA